MRAEMICRVLPALRSRPIHRLQEVPTLSPVAEVRREDPLSCRQVD